MDALRLAVAGLWARRGVSLVLLVVAAAAVAAACAGPLYLAAGRESLLRDALSAAPPPAVGLELSRPATEVPGSLARLRADVDRLTGDLPVYAPGIGGVERDLRVLDAAGEPFASTRLVYRDGACDHVSLTSGRCPASAGEVALSGEAARVAGVQVGSPLGLTATFGSAAGALRTTVVGVWEVRDTAEPYWYGRDYFVALRGAGNGTAVDAVLTAEGTFRDLPAVLGARPGMQSSTTVLVDRPVDPARSSLADVPLLRARLATLPGRVAALPERTVLSSLLPFTLDTAERAGAGLRRPVLLVTAQLLVLAWFVLYTVVAGATSARGVEVALAKLRGFSPGATIAFALLETVLVLLAAVPLGLLAGVMAVRLLARAALGPAVPVALTSTALVAAAAALAGALVASLLAAARVVRQPVLALLRRAGSSRRGVDGLVVELAVLAAAVAALVRLARPGDGPPSSTALLAPGLIAVVAAVVAARLLPVLCRAAFARTRDRQRIGPFLAVRQVARRPAGLRVVLVLGTAFGLVTFAVVGDGVFRGNRADRALAETGAAQVLTVDPARSDVLRDLVRAADPGGRSAMAVVTYEGGTRQPVRLVGVDTARLDAVPYWRDDLTGAGAAQVAAELQDAPAGRPVPAAVSREVAGGDALTAAGLDGLDLELTVVAELAFVPRYGPRAALADLGVLQARTTRPVAAARAEVWLAPGSDAVVQRLREAGLRIDRSEAAETRADRFGRQAPSLALQLFLAGAGAAAVLALGGTVLELYLLGRRRAFEVAAMAGVGLPRRQLVTSVLVEQGLVLGTGVLVGVAAGLVAVRLTLPVVPEYTDTPRFPDIVLTPDPVFVSLLVGGIVVALAAGVVGSAVLLVRAAVPSRLREAQP